jgi:excisionase family DNA binding protein
MGAKMRGTSAAAASPIAVKPVAETRDRATGATVASGHAPAAPLLLSVEESAAQLRIGRSRMFSLIKSGEVLSVMVGGSRRIPYDALQDYVKRLVTEQAASGGGLPAA